MPHSPRALAAGFAVFAAVAIAAEPGGEPPILPAAAAPKGATRVRVPLRHGDDGKVLRMKVLVPKGGKKGEFEEATAAVASGIGYGLVTVGKLKSWGYAAAAGKPFTLPELVLPAEQIAPAPPAGRAVRARVAGLKFQVAEGTPGGKDEVFGTDLLINYVDVAKTPAAEFRLYLADRLFDLNLPAAQVAPAAPPADPEPAAKPSPADPALQAFAAAVTNKPAGPALAGVAVNGVAAAKGMSGRAEPLTMVLSTAHFARPGLVLTRGMAYAVGLDAAVVQEGKAGTVGDRKAEFVPATLKELRFAVRAGPGLTAAKEIVLADVPVLVEKSTSEPVVFAGPHFFTEYFRDAVYAGGPTGGTLHARVKPDRLQDPKPRPKNP